MLSPDNKWSHALPDWAAGLEWNRVVTRYNRDTDIIFAGLGYRRCCAVRDVWTLYQC